MLWRNSRHNYLEIAIHFQQSLLQEEVFFIILKRKKKKKKNKVVLKLEAVAGEGAIKKPIQSVKILHVGV